MMFPLGFIYFDLKNEVSIVFLISIKILIKLQKTQKTVDTLSRHKTDFAQLSAYLIDTANVNFGKCHSAYKLLTKGNEQLLPTKCPVHLVEKASKKGYDLLTCDNKDS